MVCKIWYNTDRENFVPFQEMFDNEDAEQWDPSLWQ